MIASPDGPRELTGPPRHLFRGVIGMMNDWLVAECRGEVGPWTYGIDAFDMYEVDQRVWLLDVASSSLLTRRRVLPTTMMLEATYQAILCEMLSLVRMEIADTEMARPGSSWRADVVAALDASGAKPEITPESVQVRDWNRQIGRLGDLIFGPLHFLDVDVYRDGNPKITTDFIRDKALPAEYSSAIPPLRTIDQTQRSINRISDRVHDVNGYEDATRQQDAG